MYDNKILLQLKEAIDNANLVKIEYGITSEEINYEENNELITVSSNTTMEVDYKNKIGSIATLTGSFLGSSTISEVFENNSERIIQSDLAKEKISTTFIEFTNKDYDNLFKPGGKLYPLEIEEFIPIKSQRNSEKTQVVIPSKKVIGCIPGYLSANYTIYHKSENVYEITLIMEQEDSITKTPLMQYCFTKIEIISYL